MGTTALKKKTSVIIFGLEIYRPGRYKRERLKKGVKLAIVESKNKWSHTSTPPICFRGEDKGNFVLLL